MDDIGKKLSLYRGEKSLRQIDVAKALNVTQQTIANWESGKPPKGARMAQLKAYLAGADDYAADVEPVKVTTPIFRLGKHFESMREMDREFVEALPEDLRRFVEVPIQFGSYAWRADYLSDKVVAETKVVRSGSSLDRHIDATIERGLMTLATIHNIHRMQLAEHNIYALILIGPAPAGYQGHARLQSAATAHGITIYQVPDPIGAAALLADLEYGPIE